MDCRAFMKSVCTNAETEVQNKRWGGTCIIPAPSALPGFQGSSYALLHKNKPELSFESLCRVAIASKNITTSHLPYFQTGTVLVLIYGHCSFTIFLSFILLNIKITNRGGMSIFGVCKMCKKQRCDAGHLIPSVPIPFRVIGIETHAEFLIACNCLGILIG